MNPARPATSAIALTLALAAAPPAAADFTTVAFTGEPAPDIGPGVTFGAFRFALINNSGQTTFHSWVSGPGVDATNNKVMYGNGSGTLTALVREGGQAPGAEPGVVFRDFSGNTSADASSFDAWGQHATRGFLMGPGVDCCSEGGIYSESEGTPREVARVGNHVPGEALGVLFNTLGIPVVNAGDEIVFDASIVVPGSDVSVDVIYRDSGGTLTEIAREGNQAPGAAPAVVFGHVEDPVLSAVGDATFTARLTGPDVVSTNDYAIYSERDGKLVEIAREAAQVPGAAPDVVFADLRSSRPVNAPGHVAFGATVAGPGVGFSNDQAIYRETGDALYEVAREGDQAPGAEPGVVFSSLGFASLNAAGQTTFNASLDGPGVDFGNDEAIYVETGGQAVEIAREGGQIPGAELGARFSHFDRAVLNATGQTAFLASGARTGIYATDRDGELIQIVRTGDVIDVNDDPLIDDFRTVGDLDFIGAYGPGEGRGSGFNDLGQITFAADFTDGTYGVFISNAVANFDTLLGDIDFDGDLDLIDVRLLGVGVGIGTTTQQGDVDADGNVDLADLDAWLALIETVNGDANLDLQIDTADLAILAGNFLNPAPTYAQGDFNLDGNITTADLAILAGAFGPDPAAAFITPATTPLVPEPAPLALLGLAGLAATARRRAITAGRNAGA